MCTAYALIACLALSLTALSARELVEEGLSWSTASKRGRPVLVVSNPAALSHLRIANSTAG